MDAKVHELLNQQINKEFYSAYSMSIAMSLKASLRWHYPNQVLGRRLNLPLSLLHKLPFLICFYILYH